MKERTIIISIFILLMCSLCACTIHNDKEIDEDKINARKEMFEKYLAGKYPDETFTVKVWQEYAKMTGSAGLPDYEGYVYRQVAIDSKGNCFMVYPGDNGTCTDDYQKVLDGWLHYNEKGQHVVYDEDGNIISEYY